MLISTYNVDNVIKNGMIDPLVRVRRLTAAQGASIKAMDRLVSYIEPETTVNNESADN